jgi:hypothetical protein
MYCPKCGAQNEDAKFCRGCGTNLSLVPQALTGRIPEARETRRQREKRGRNRPATLQGGIVNVSCGLGFLFVTVALLAFEETWAIWMLIPAFACLGKGVADIVSFKYDRSRQLPQSHPEIGQAAAGRDTGELIPPRAAHLSPPSVTEGTTKIIDPTLERGN